DRTWAALAACYDGAVAACDLRIIELPHASARLLSVRAYAAHARGEYTQAVALWQQARALDPGRADSAYNLACAQARLGAGDDAVGALADAIALGGSRYQALAR